MATGDNPADEITTMSRKEKRKLLKKQKRKQVRREIAVKEKEEEEAESNDPELQNKLRELELEELDRMERDRREFEERERRFFEAMELKKREQEKYEEEQRKLAEEFPKQDEDEDQNEGSDWEYVEDGPPEIIWQGNEIIVRKKKVRVLKKILEERSQKEDLSRPISNPLAPQSEVYEDHRSAQQLLDSVAQQVPNFGTEQDKAHCPFHLKTGACRFGTRCSRVHFYPDKSCTLLMKGMYGGPGLTWEQDEGLEHTDEEIESYFEDFYEDVHTEFLKFGEIVNFKVCRNGSPHLRGNIYVHYKSLESAVAAYHSTNGRYFAGKQVICEFVNLTKWKVAICGEYMKSRFKTCSRGSACNFIHCFRNPGGDYEWADWDKPPPRYWVKRMAALFGYDKQHDEMSPVQERSSRSLRTGSDSHYTRFRSREPDNRVTSSYHDEDGDDRISKGQQSRDFHKRRENSPDRGRNEEVMRHYDDSHYSMDTSHDAYYDGDQSDKESRRIEHGAYYDHKKRQRHREWHSRSPESNSAKDRSGQDTRERHRSDRKSHRSYRQRSTGKSHGSDSDKESSRGRHREARTSSRRKKRDSSYTDDECSSREENNQKNHFSEVNPRKRHKYGGADLRVSNDDSCEDTMGSDWEVDRSSRRKSSAQSNNRLDCSDHDSLEDGRRSSKSGSRKADMSASSQCEKRGSDKQRKRERSHHTSERRSSRQDQNDHSGLKRRPSDVEGSERIHKHRKRSSWDCNKASELTTTVNGGQFKQGDMDLLNESCKSEGTGAGFKSSETMSSKEYKGSEYVSKEVRSSELSGEDEQAYRRAALEKLQEKKQSEKQLDVETPKSSHCETEIEPGSRRRLRI